MAYPISDVPRRIVYSGSAGVGPYAFTFEVLANTDIAVYKNTTLLTLTTDYTVSINTGTGTGTVTLVVAATGADTVTIVGDRAIQRTSDFVTGGDLFANTLNNELDAQTIYTQQVDEKADRAIRSPVTDPTTISMVLPSQASRAQKLLGFNASGEPTTYVATTTVSDTSLINFTQAGTGAVTRTAQAKMRDVVSVRDFGAVGDGVTDDTAAIQAAIDYIETLNGGVIEVPRGAFRISSTLQIDGGKGVQFIGQGSDGIHDGGTGAAAATTVTWFGSAGGTMLNISSTSGAGNSRQFGSSVVDVKFDCRSVAGIGLLVNSVRNCNFSRLYIFSPTIAGIKTTTLGNANLAESSDIQRCVFDRISVRAIDDAATRPAHGLWLTSHSPVGSNSNTSLNLFTQCDMQMWGGTGSGYGLFLEDGDNNTFMNLRVSRANATTVEAVRLVGNTNCDANHFWNLSAGGLNSITIKGTASGFAINPRKNSFWATDVGNGTQYPTADANVIFAWNSDNNTYIKQLVNQLVVADSDLQATGNLANIGSASQYIFNGSDNHLLLSDAVSRWGIAIDSVTGDLRLLRLVGSGAVNVGNGLPVKILGKNVTEGAADSGGVGFRVLRVPN